MLILSPQMARCSSLHQILPPQTTAFVHCRGKMHAQQLIRGSWTFMSHNSPLCLPQQSNVVVVVVWFFFCVCTSCSLQQPTAGVAAQHYALARRWLSPPVMSMKEGLSPVLEDIGNQKVGEEGMNTGTVYWACNTLKRMLTSSISIQSMPELLEMFHGGRGLKSSIW